MKDKKHPCPMSFCVNLNPMEADYTLELSFAIKKASISAPFTLR